MSILEDLQLELKRLQDEYDLAEKDLKEFNDQVFYADQKHNAATVDWISFEVGMSILQKYQHAAGPRGLSEDVNRSFDVYKRWMTPRVLVFRQDAESLEKLQSDKDRLKMDLVEEVVKLIRERFAAINEIEKKISEMSNPAIEYVQNRQASLESKRNALKMQKANVKEQIFRHRVELTGTDLPQAVGDRYKIEWFDAWANLPHKAGVYLLYRNSILDYVGESQDLRIRVTQSHHVYEYPAHLIGVIITGSGFEDNQERKELEQFLIKRLRPVRNVKGQDDPPTSSLS